MRFSLLLLALALALAGCAKTGGPQVPPPVGKMKNPDAPLAHLPPLPEKPTHLVRLPDGTVVEEVRP